MTVELELPTDVQFARAARRRKRVQLVGGARCGDRHEVRSLNVALPSLDCTTKPQVLHVYSLRSTRGRLVYVHVGSGVVPHTGEST